MEVKDNIYAIPYFFKKQHSNIDKNDTFSDENSIFEKSEYDEYYRETIKRHKYYDLSLLLEINIRTLKERIRMKNGEIMKYLEDIEKAKFSCDTNKHHCCHCGKDMEYSKEYYIIEYHQALIEKIQMERVYEDLKKIKENYIRPKYKFIKIGEYFKKNIPEKNNLIEDKEIGYKLIVS